MKNKSTDILLKILPYVIIFVGFLLVPAFTAKQYMLSIFIMVMYKIIGAVGLRTLMLSGNLSFSHGSIIALGAYFAGIVVKDLSLPAPLAILGGGIFAALFAVGTGFPFVRLRGLYYAMASMFMGITVITIIKALKITGGYRGLTGIPGTFSSGVFAYYFFVGLMVVSLLMMYRFEHSRIGTTLRALSQSVDVASSIGINVTKYQLLAVGMGSFFGGIAGGGYALYLRTLSTTNYDMNFSLWLLMFVMIGGKDKFIGPIIGTIILALVPEMARGASSYAPYFTAAVMLLVAYLIPGGITGIPEKVRQIREKRAGKPKGGVDNAA